MYDEVKVRLSVANKSYCAMIEMFLSEVLLRAEKERGYTLLIIVP